MPIRILGSEKAVISKFKEDAHQKSGLQYAVNWRLKEDAQVKILGSK